MSKSYQILAPAGSVEQLKMAVNNGCDAIYLGVDKFNARMKAENFTTENLAQWVDYCHLFGVKVYVAINTSLKNDEFQQAVETLLSVYFSNADGVILTDLALIKIASNFPKPFEIVASTQLNAHDKYGAEFLKELGADTVVCARECSYEDIKDIASTGVNVECFIHGALCVCQSGQCLFSSMVGGNSGNRGLCAQPCRKKYVVNGNEGYFLSPRDMYGLDVAKSLLDAGVTTFKIEGRNRRPEYAGMASRVYSTAFANDFEYSEQDKINLAEMYNRGGFEDISYLNGKNDNVIFPKAQSHIGVQVGEIQGKGFVAKVPITKGDGLKVISNGKEVCGGVATSGGCGFISAEFSSKVTDGMAVHRTTAVELCNQIVNTKRTLNVQIDFVAFADLPAKIIAKYGDVVVEVESEFVVSKAQNQPLQVEQVVQQLQKTGNSYYTITDIDVKIGEIFLTKGQINSLRREVLEKLTVAIIKNFNARFDNRKCFVLREYYQNISTASTNPCLGVICKTANQIDLAQADYVIFKPEFIRSKTSTAPQKFFYLDLPSFAKLSYLENIIHHNMGIVCHNIGQVRFARKHNLRYIAGSGLNIFNDQMASVFADADTFVYSLELTLSEISQFKIKSGLIFVDGDIPLMKVVHCPYKVIYQCDCNTCKCHGKLQYVDQLGNTFNIQRRQDNRCTFEIVNGKKLSVAGKLAKMGRYLVDFDCKVIAHYLNLNNGVIDNFKETQPYTKGRLFNKIN